MREKLVTLLWLLLLISVITILAIPESRELFKTATGHHPYIMGFLKIGLLGIMGGLLADKIVGGVWRLTGVHIWHRALVWGFLGIIFTAVFPLFSYGIDGLLAAGLLPGEGQLIVGALWKSLFMNLIFGFPMMVFHRFTENLIERNQLFKVWPVAEAFGAIDWNTMFRVVGFSCIWFWTPAHTITFTLPPEYRIVFAALLTPVLGFILGMAGRKSTVTTPQPVLRPAAPLLGSTAAS